MIQGMPIVVLWIAYLAFASYHLVRTTRAVLGRDPAQLADLGQDFEIRDFEGFWRCALRMQKGEVMYFPHTGERLEMPSKHGPFFELLMRPLLPLGAAWAEIVFAALSLVLLAATLPLVQRVLDRAAGGPQPRWLPWLVLLAACPFVHLAATYSQTVFLMVFLWVLGLLAFEKRPFLAGVLFALPAAIKLLPLAVLPWLVWRRSWRAAAGMTLGLVATTAAVVVDQGPALAQRQAEAYVHMLRVDPVYETYHERFQSLAPLVLGTITPRYETGLASSTQRIDWNGRRNFLGSEGLMAHGHEVVLGASALLAALCAFACWPRGRDSFRKRLGEAGLVLMAMLLLTPHTWKHYFWWHVPALAFALLEATQRRTWALWFCAIYALTQSLPHRGLLPTTWAQAFHVFHGLAAGQLVLCGLLAMRLARSEREPQGEASR